MDLVIDLLYKIVPEIMLSIIAGHVLRRNKEALSHYLWKTTFLTFNSHQYIHYACDQTPPIVLKLAAWSY